MTSSKGESRSIAGVAFEAFVKAEKAKRRAEAAAAELKTWTRNLNEAEQAEYDAAVEQYHAEQEK